MGKNQACLMYLSYKMQYRGPTLTDYFSLFGFVGLVLSYTLLTNLLFHHFVVMTYPDFNGSRIYYEFLP